MPSQLIRLVSRAVLVDGLLGGASLDRTFTQLPAFRRVGVRPRAGPRSFFWYPTLAISGTTLSVSAAVKCRSENVSRFSSAGLIAAAVLAAGGLLATIGGAPSQLRIRGEGDDGEEPSESFDEVDFWEDIRGPLQGLAFAANVMALLSLLAEEGHH